MGRGALGAYQPPCKAIATIRRDGTAFVRSGGTDMGPGTYTVMTMLAADCLGVPIERVRFGLGDSAMPKAPQEGGSGFTGALGNAVHATCVSVVRAFVNLVSDDELSPLKGLSIGRPSPFATEAFRSPTIRRALKRTPTSSRGTVWTR